MALQLQNLPSNSGSPYKIPPVHSNMAVVVVVGVVEDIDSVVVVSIAVVGTDGSAARGGDDGGDGGARGDGGALVATSSHRFPKLPVPFGV